MSFLWHFPAGFPGSALPTTLPCDVRTFLEGYHLRDCSACNVSIAPRAIPRSRAPPQPADCTPPTRRPAAAATPARRPAGGPTPPAQRSADPHVPQRPPIGARAPRTPASSPPRTPDTPTVDGRPVPPTPRRSSVVERAARRRSRSRGDGGADAPRSAAHVMLRINPTTLPSTRTSRLRIGSIASFSGCSRT